MSATPTAVISPEASVRHHQALSLSQSAVSPLTVVTKPAAASSALMMPASASASLSFSPSVTSRSKVWLSPSAPVTVNWALTLASEASAAAVSEEAASEDAATLDAAEEAVLPAAEEAPQPASRPAASAAAATAERIRFMIFIKRLLLGSSLYAQNMQCL